MNDIKVGDIYMSREHRYEVVVRATNRKGFITISLIDSDVIFDVVSRDFDYLYEKE